MYVFKCLSTRLSKLCTSAGVFCTSPLSGTRLETETCSPPPARANDAHEIHLNLPGPNTTERIEVRSIPNIDKNGHLGDSKHARKYSMKVNILEVNRENIKRTNQTTKGQKCITKYPLLRRAASI